VPEGTLHCPFPTPGGEQQIVTLVGHGYSQYCLTIYPEKKRLKWLEIDRKIIDKHETDLGKDQRYRRQVKGFANCIFLRWESIAVILRTPGEFNQGDDTFYDVSDKPLIIQVGETLRLKIVPVGSRGRCTVYIDKTVFRELKAELMDHCRHHRRDVLLKRFQGLNGIPAFSGITQQKSGLVTSIVKEGNLHGLKLLRKDFPIYTARKIHKVFD
jgi:hypothetical protein